MSQIQQLYRLQLIDTDILNGKKRLLEVLNAQKEPPALQEARQRAETAAAEATKWRVQQKDEDLELGSLHNKIQQSEARLYSGNVKTTSEMADLEKAIRSMKRRREVLEENLLATMMELEAAEEEKTAADEALATFSKEWAEKTAALKQEQHQLALQINEWMAARTKQAELVGAKEIAAYEAIRKRRTTGVALMKLESCQGCQVGISNAVVRRVNQGELVPCPSCGRFLCPM
jgi:predicted  nucleic acid-binding Zn-ribbon protein